MVGVINTERKLLSTCRSHEKRIVGSCVDRLDGKDRGPHRPQGGASAPEKAVNRRLGAKDSARDGKKQRCGKHHGFAIAPLEAWPPPTLFAEMQEDDGRCDAKIKSAVNQA